MNNIHQKLYERYSAYKSWHDSVGSDVLHWLILITIPILLFSRISSSINQTVSLVASVQVGENQLDYSRKTLVSLANQTKHSEYVLKGKATAIEVFEESNIYGDQLIMTRVTVSVDEDLKGISAEVIKVDMVGGTLEGITMGSSKEPEPLKPNEQAVLFLKREAPGLYRLVDGESGFYKLKGGVASEHGNLTFDEIRSVVKNSK
jgi:hypothetical protein